MPINEYFQTQQSNLRQISETAPFSSLFPALDDLYISAFKLLPGTHSRLSALILLICHRSLLSAAALIGQGQSQDAGPITRRAIEAACFAAAVKTNPKLAKGWIEARDRLERWIDRAAGKKPKALKRTTPDIDPAVRPRVDHLMGMLGVLSDTDAHFTPEFLAGIAWDDRCGSTFLNYFDKEPQVRVVVFTSAVHLSILEILDWCFDGAFQSGAADWQVRLNRVAEEGIRWRNG